MPYNLRFGEMRFISGLIGIPFIALFFSSDPSRIRIRPILFGLTVQVLMGVICFQFPIGRYAIQSAASAVQKGVNYSQAGAEFVFGDSVFVRPKIHNFYGIKTRQFSYKPDSIAFSVMPIILYISSIIAVLFYII